MISKALSPQADADRPDAGGVTVVIPCYNASRYLPATIRSALRQTCAPREVIVVDDGSTDGSAEIAASFAGPVRLIRQENRGAHLARARGVAEATSEFVAFQDADDTVDPTRLKDLLAALVGHPECVAAIGVTANEHDGSRTPPGPLGMSDDGSVIVADDTLGWMLRFGAPIAGAMNLLARRTDAAEAFRMSRGLPAANDYDFQLHLASKGDFVVKRKVNCRYLPGASGITSKGSAALQPAMAICAAVAALRFAENADSRRIVLARLSSRGPQLIVPLIANGQFHAALCLAVLLIRSGRWGQIPRRVWWGVQHVFSH